MRRTVSTMLVQRALDVFKDQEWTIEKCLLTSPKSGYPLATCDTDRRVITMYPKILGNAEPPLGRSLLHELIAHLLLGLGPTQAEEDEATWWEKTVWRQLPQCWKDKLTAMVEAGQDEES